jgi:elongation factor G
MTSRRTFPLSVEIRPANQADAERFPDLLGSCQTPDIDFNFTVDRSNGNALLCADGELDLEIIIERLINELSERPHIGAPKVRYREVLTRESEVEYRHKRMRAGVEEFAFVHFRLTLIDPDLPLSFVSECQGNHVSPGVFEAIAKGVSSVGEAGLIAEEPIYGVQVTLVALRAIEGVSAPLHFEIAARAALREGFRRSLKLYEPITRLHLNAPAVNAVEVLKDLLSRRGSVLRQRTDDVRVVIEADVPLSQTFGYVNGLRYMTGERFTCTQRFSHYAPVPTRSGPDDPDDFAPAMALRP